MKTKLGKLFMLLGGLCLIASLLLVFYNQRQARQAQLVSQKMLAALDGQIEQRRQPDLTQPTQIPQTDSTEPDPTLPVPTVPVMDPEMETVEIDGLDYIGKLIVPTLGLELPVLADWSYSNLRLAPCRYAGNLATGDLVLMAHNYQMHFGQFHSLPQGTPVYFSDVNQKLTAYEVVSIETLQPEQLEEMTAGEYDLTLFTCTYGGQSRVTVRCEEKEMIQE